MYACFNWATDRTGQVTNAEYSYAGLVRPGVFTVGTESPTGRSQLELTEPQFRRLFTAIFAQMQDVDSRFVDAVIHLNRKEPS